MNGRAAELYRDYLNETDPASRELLRQAYYQAIEDKPDEPPATEEGEKDRAA